MFDSSDSKDPNLPENQEGEGQEEKDSSKNSPDQADPIDPSVAAAALAEARSDILDEIEFAASAINPEEEPSFRRPAFLSEEEDMSFEKAFSLFEEKAAENASFGIPAAREEPETIVEPKEETPPELPVGDDSLNRSLTDQFSEIFASWEVSQHHFALPKSSANPSAENTETDLLRGQDDTGNFSAFQDKRALPKEEAPFFEKTSFPVEAQENDFPVFTESESKEEDDDSDEFDLAAVTQALSETGMSFPQIPDFALDGSLEENTHLSSENQPQPAKKEESFLEKDWENDEAFSSDFKKIEAENIAKTPEKELKNENSSSKDPPFSLDKETVFTQEEESDFLKKVLPEESVNPLETSEAESIEAPKKDSDQELREMLDLPEKPLFSGQDQEEFSLSLSSVEEEDLFDAAGMVDETKVLDLDDLVEISPISDIEEISHKTPSVVVLPPPVPSSPSQETLVAEKAPEVEKETTTPLFADYVHPPLKPLPKQQTIEHHWLRILSAEVFSEIQTEKRARFLYEAAETYETDLLKPNEALACYQASLEQDPTFHPSSHGLLRMLGQEKNWDIVLFHLEKSVRETKGEERAWLQIERALIQEATLHDENAAKLSYQAALDASPTSFASALALSRLARSEAHWKDTAKYWQITANILQNPTWKSAFLFELALLNERGFQDIPKARENILEALQLEPNVFHYLSALARLTIWQQDFSGFIEALKRERLIAEAPEGAAILRLIAATNLYRTGDAQSAWASLEESLGLIQGDFALVEAAARVADKTGLHPESFALKRHLIDLTSSSKVKQALLLELALSLILEKTQPFDGELRDLLIGASKEGEYTFEARRIANRLARRVGDKAAERVLLTEYRDATTENPKIQAETNLMLARLSDEAIEVEKRLQGALHWESYSLDAALALADRGRDMEDPAFEFDAISSAIPYVKGKEEAAILGLRWAALARFRVQDSTRYVEAIEFLVSKNILPKRELALAFLWSRRPNEAAQIFAEIIEQTENLREGEGRLALLNLASIKETLGDKKFALKLYQRLEKANPGDLEALIGLERTLADSLFLASVYERAATSQKNPKEAIPLLYRSAVLYLQQNLPENAIKIYEKLSLLAPNAPLVTLGQIVAARLYQKEHLLEKALTLAASQEGEFGAICALELGAMYEAKKEKEAAKEAYERALSAPPAISLPAKDLLLSLAIRQNNWEQVTRLAAPSLEDFSEENIQNRRALRLHLASLLETTHPEQAKSYYEGILAESANDIIALRGFLRVSSSESNDPKAAVAASEQLASVLGIPSLSASARLQAARLLSEQNEDGVLEHLSVALAMSRTDPRVLYSVESQRGHGATRSDLRAAYEARLSTASASERSVYLVRLGELEAQFGQIKEVLPILELARERAPEDMATLLSIRRCARVTGDKEAFLQASQTLASQIRTDKLAAKILREAAESQEEEGELALAKTLYSQALKRDPDDGISLIKYSQILGREQSHDDLISFVKENPNTREIPEILVSLGLALYQQGKELEARNVLCQVLAKQPGNRTVLLTLYEIAFRNNLFLEAAEIANRILKRETEASPRAQASRKIAEALLHTKRKKEALQHFQNYLIQNPGDQEILETFLQSAKSFGRSRDAIVYLDERYQKAQTREEKRIIAERFGQFYEESNPKQLDLAAEWYAKALGQDPLGATCGDRIVSLWKSQKEKRLAALLEGTQLLLSKTLQTEPARWEIYRRLAEIFGWRNNRVRYHAIRDLAQAVQLEEELPPFSIDLVPYGLPTRPLTPEEQRFLTPQKALHPGRQYLTAIREILPKAFAKSPSDLGLGRKDRLREGSKKDRRQEAASIGSLFGLKISEAYVGGDPLGCCVLQSGTDLFVVIGEGLIGAPLPVEARFDLGRAFTLARIGLLPLLDAGKETIEGCLRGMSWWGDETLRERKLSEESEKAAKAVYQSTTRSLRKNLSDQFSAVANHFPPEIEPLAQGLVEEADRGGLIAAGSLLGPLKRFSDFSQTGTEALRLLLAKKRALVLIQYALSKEYEELILALSTA